MPGTLHRRGRTLALALVIGLLGGLLPQPTHAAAPTLSTSVIKTGLVYPWDIAFLPNGQMLVTERPGRVRVYASGSPNPALLRTITIPNVWAVGEAGLMGIAVDIDFATNRYVYLCATRKHGSATQVNEVIRYSIRADGSWGGAAVLVTGMKAANIHNGCAVEMDPSGRVLVAMGDAATPGLAQNRSSLNGKILRMNRDGGTPGDNPVINGTRNIVFTMGHRNPQGIAIRPGTNQVYAIEHGPDRDDEINLLVGGGNYGWPCYTGAGNPYQTSGCGPASSYRNPLWASAAPTLATSGGAFVAGSQWADFNGHLFVSTLKESDVRRFSIDAAGTSLGGPATHFNGSWGRLRAVVLGPGGQLYVTTSDGSDQVVRIRPAQPSVGRIAGANRYETAARVSVHGFPSGATDVMVATGLGFPDALAGSAVGGSLGMPVLLTTKSEIPTATKNELARLKPQRIWVLGGTGVIAESVRTQLQAYASSGSATRVFGPDRYATAAEISERWYGENVPAAFVAVGTNFADALAGAPAAAKLDAPLLLVQSGSVPAATRAELERLKPQRIYLLGGTAVIGAAVATQLDALTTGPVTRLAGANRYGTADAIIRAFWSKSVTGYVADGTNFPDALAGGAVAGKNGVPMILTAPGFVPLESGQPILRLSPRQLTMLGGTAALGTAVESGLKRLLATP